MLHFHFIPNASFFIAFLGHTHTHTFTHTHIRKWQPSQTRAPANSPRWAALSVSLCAARESARARSITIAQRAIEQNNNETKRNETRRDENAIRDTRNVKRENETQRTAPFAVGFVRLLQYLFVACRVLKEAAGANTAQCRQFRFN